MPKGKDFEILKYHSLYEQTKKEGDEMVNQKRNTKGGKMNSKGNKKTNPTYEKMMNAIRDKEKTLKDVFRPIDYALPGGYADATAKIVIVDTNNNQIRKIFGSIKSIDMRLKNKSDYDNLLNEIYMLMPSIIYAKKRKLINDSLYDIFKECIKPEKLKSKEDFYSFAKFMEALVAYCKKEDF
ncbi:MAG: type III-A CRISPR-associated protein Csm2 [Epulopiscium sp.]|jgi:CRISPR type III-A-associated protein Csm2|nr:type III-A CRISPR-associated protein Csm2 [Candidatus Epulonipiscium sp.]